MRVLAVDPGLANTGIVLFERSRITRAWTLKTPSAGRRTDFASAVDRGRVLADGIARIRNDIGTVDVAVVELYRDIPGELRKAANRWTTPLAIGLMVGALEAISDEPLVWQDPETVMRATKQFRLLWAAGQRALVPGDNLVTNDHLRSAAGHGVYYLGSRRA